jgi:hypothetical protein
MHNVEGTTPADGIHSMVPRSQMANDGIRKLRDFYDCKPDAPIYLREFGFYCLGRWRSEGHIDEDTDLQRLFGFDEPGLHGIGGLIGRGYVAQAECGIVAPFSPFFEEKVLEDRGRHELVQDRGGRSILCPKGKRTGFMPTFVDHPVKDLRSWEEKVRWRLDAKSPERYEDLTERMSAAQKAARQGMVIRQQVIGGYMYLRSLIGPEDLLLMFYDNPELIHECMRTWLKLADTVVAKHQEYVTLDDVSFTEDICYKNGSLISPAMIRSFLLPYYQQLVHNTKRRQIDRHRHLYVHVDTDGYADPVIPVYQEIGMDFMSPFEVAAGCDVVATGKRYENLLMLGGIDKRILALGKDEIDREIDRILPVMKRRGGYIPTSDHGVPEEVSFENYVHFRKRVLEFAG